LHRQSDSRIKVAGTVIYHSPSGKVYLRCDGVPVRGRLLVPLPRAQPQGQYHDRAPVIPLQPGERVELVGAPAATLHAPLLQDAEFRRTGQEQLPLPLTMTTSDGLSGARDGELVSVKARLLAVESRLGPIKQQVLALQAGDTIFEALWEFTGTNTLPELKKNSHLLATGICEVQLGELNQVRSFRLLVRTPGDLRVIAPPPLWETPAAGRIALGVLALTVVALGWVGLLRRQVAQRTAELRAEVSRRQQAQAELDDALQAERELSEFRSRFVSLVSHEFRTPLGVILSAAENLRTYFERLEPAQRRQQLDHVIQATGQMARVMENVLLLGRAEARKMEFKPGEINLAPFCESLVAQVQSSTGSRCPIHFEAEPMAPCMGDEHLLAHILNNVLTNAVKYSEPGDPVEFKLSRVNGDAVFYIRDRGMGIPALDQKQLFNAFHRGRNAVQVPGTGLGLVIVKRCVELHGGSIECESTEGAGTSFTISLPLFEPAHSLNPNDQNSSH
jgi:signal transduction histidine kinase